MGLISYKIHHYFKLVPICNNSIEIKSSIVSINKFNLQELISINKSDIIGNNNCCIIKLNKNINNKNW
jgi:hypothetical protein